MSFLSRFNIFKSKPKHKFYGGIKAGKLFAPTKGQTLFVTEPLATGTTSYWNQNPIKGFFGGLETAYRFHDTKGNKLVKNMDFGGAIGIDSDLVLSGRAEGLYKFNENLNFGLEFRGDYGIKSYSREIDVLEKELGSQSAGQPTGTNQAPTLTDDAGRTAKQARLDQLQAISNGIWGNVTGKPAADSTWYDYAADLIGLQLSFTPKIFSAKMKGFAADLMFVLRLNMNGLSISILPYLKGF